MCQFGNMKFWQRVLASVSVLGFVTLSIYISLPDQLANLELHHQHRMKERSTDRDSGTKHWSYTGSNSVDPEMCRLSSDSPTQHANISTYDLFYSTQFNVKSSGEWEMLTPTQNQQRTFTPPRLTVLLVPHSHNDPGWLKTVNEYYSDNTRHILNNMVAKLIQYPNMTFIWTETVFFSMWWNEIEDVTKVHVRRLIRRRQLEITLGGWVMPDEASSHYVGVVDQLIEGHQWLWENLGVRPENSWSIDPFGYSSTMPYLWQKSGMSNMVIQRVHQAVKTSLLKEKALEFYWRQMWDGSGTTDIFCHVMPFMLYNIKYTCGPNQFACLHFDFREIPGDFAEVRGAAITNDNIEYSAEMLYHQYRAKASFFRYNTILVPIGDDFRFDKEKEWDQQYENYEKLIHYMHSRPEWNVRVRWATLHDYFRQIKTEHVTDKSFGGKIQDFPVLSGDFFPYSDKDMAYWTGYFSTRAFDKSFGRDVQATLQAADILNTYHYAYYKHWGRNPEIKFSTHSSLLQQARRFLGLFLHHDAITGTAKAFVAEDYEKYLLQAYTQSQEVIGTTLQALLTGGKFESPVVLHPEILRKTHTSLPEKQVIAVLELGTTLIFFNPLGQARQQIVHILVDTNLLEVISSSQQIVPSQIRPVWSNEHAQGVLDNIFELTFLVEIGPFSIVPITVYKKSTRQDSVHTSALTAVNCKQPHISSSSQFKINKSNLKSKSSITINNNVIELNIDPETGSLLSITDLATGNVTALNVSFQVYTSRGSGAYIFSPKDQAKIFTNDIPVITVVDGSLATTVTIIFGLFLNQTITLYNNPAHVASTIFIENTLNLENFPGKEVIIRFNSDLRNSDLSYFTDQNAFQLIRRRTNRGLPTEANYYPMTSAVVLEDLKTRLTIMSAQSHGVACLETGQVEIMLDRHLVYDDNRGMGEGVTDIKRIISKFAVLVEKRIQPSTPSPSTPSQPTPSPHHYISLSLTALVVSDMLQQPLVTYYTTVDKPVSMETTNLFHHSLPCEISATSFRSLANGDLNYNGTSLILHRRGYDCNYPASDLICSPSDSSLTFETMFKDLPLSNIRETTLTHTATKRSVRPTDRISIVPMELASFHFHL